MAEPDINHREIARIDIWHNILWSSYRGRVFSELHTKAQRTGAEIRFFQIAETDSERKVLSPIDKANHIYPYTLLFAGSYDAIPVFRLCAKIFWLTFRSRADLIVLSGYSRPEYWIQAAVAVLRRKKLAVLCASTLYDKKRTLARTVLKRFLFSLCSGVI